MPVPWLFNAAHMTSERDAVVQKLCARETCAVSVIAAWSAI